MDAIIYLVAVLATLSVTGYAATVVLDEDARSEDVIPAVTAAIVCAFIFGSIAG